MKILIATKNPGKIEGAKRAFLNYFDDITIEGIPASSDVGEEPVNDELYNGSNNRVENLKKYAKDNSIDYIYLYSFSLNEKAKDFYLKNNFVISGVWSALEYKGIKNPKSYFYSYKVK